MLNKTLADLFDTIIELFCNKTYLKDGFETIFLLYHVTCFQSWDMSIIYDSTCYAAVQINNCLKGTSAIKIATMKITENLLRMEAIPQNQHFMW